MAQNTLEQEKTIEQQREDEMTRKYGRRVSELSNQRTTAPIREPHTPAEMDKFAKLFEQGGEKYIRIDPVTKKEFAEAKDYFWMIISFTTECLGSTETDVRINFLIQKYHRDPKLMYKATEMVNGSSRDVMRFRAYMERNPTSGDLISTGDRLIDASDFLEQFKPE